MKKRLLGVAVGVLAISWGAMTGSASAATTCENTKPFANVLPAPDPSTNEDGVISGTIHNSGEVVDHRLPPEYRPVHYVNCKVIAPNDPT